MTNIIRTNNQNLRLPLVCVGKNSVLRLAFPLIPEGATNVEVILTTPDTNTHTAYSAIWDTETAMWISDIAAAQFPAVGRQEYEVAYKLGDKQFWDGKGWVKIEDATTSGIIPPPVPPTPRYAVASVNGITPDTEGNVVITGADIPLSTSDVRTINALIEGLKGIDLIGNKYQLKDLRDKINEILQAIKGE